MTESSNVEDVTAGAVNLASLETQDVISKFQRNSQDTGSPEVQIALLTKRLTTLTKHFGSNPKDHHSKRGMLNMISQRKRMLQYLRNEDVARYRSTIAALGLRK
jgi:small subunit ribosomal protein S15